MTEELIKIEIIKCEKEINFHKMQINDLNTKIDELERGYNKINGKYNEFYESNNNKLEKLNKVLIESNNVPISKNIYEKFKQLYSGKDFYAAQQGFVQSMDKIKRKLVELYNEIDNHKSEIKIQENHLAYLKQQYLIEMEKGEI